MKPMKRYACHYHRGGMKWATTIDAKDWDDAEEQAKASGLILDGELLMTLPARAGWVAKAVCVIRNLLSFK